MKDDFYKDMEHKRREQKKDSSSKKRKRTKVDPELSRSARYKEEDKKQNSKNYSKKSSSKKSVTTTPSKNTHTNNNKAGLTGFTQNVKTYLLTTRDKYQKQLSTELSDSKGKLKGLRESTFKKFKSKNNNRKWKALLLLILTPIVLLFGFMIISNFWPADKDYTVNPEQTVEAVDKRQVNPDFEQKKAEFEKGFSSRDKENKKTEKDSDNQTENNTTSREYSDEEISSMKTEAEQVIKEKKEQVDETQTSEPEINESNNNSDSNTSSNSDSKTDEATANEEKTTDEIGVTHTVNSSDNLYRIAMQYYGNASEENVQKIRDANGLSGNELNVGQELIIP